ncbi:transposase family protein [Patescibacteria group bacterium]|nr:transposase family protein [Patescibacteria group bacterium]
MISKVDRKYLSQLQNRYKTARRKQRIIILDELTKTTGYDRKHAGKLVRGKYRHIMGAIKHPRSLIYTREDADILEKVWELLGWIASKRLKPSLSLALDQLILAGRVSMSKEDRKRFVKMSPATVDRLLTRYKKRVNIRGRSYTKPGTLLKSQIPIRTFSEWNENKVGFFEIDLVGHDGSLVKGDFAWTLDFVDVKSAWTEQAAVFNKAQVHVFAGIQRIRARLPFPLLGLDSDSGAEFINDQLYRYCIQEQITFTRGRPGKKNDNPYIEQKNDSIVRNWVGYGRFDTQPQVDTLNELYELLRLYTNFFLPVMKLKKKIRIGSKIRKVHDRAATPYKRILRARDVSKKLKNKLKAQYKTLNLVKLKEQIDEVLKRLKPTPLKG